jgi:hypothetical protein
MKKFYILLVFSIPFINLQKIEAQCTCADGSTPDSISYKQYFDSIIATNTTISFPQFDPAVGILTCLRLSDTVTTVVNYNLENNLDSTEDYNFETYRRSQFTAPDGFFSSVVSAPKDYGPYTLGPYDSSGTGDQVNVGPDTVFNQNTYTKYASGSPGFYGTGMVNFNYLTTSTFTILTGSDNAIIKLRAYTRLGVNLVYYWCPFTALQTHLTNFTTSFQGNRILVQWQINDLQNSNTYEVEASTDGKVFQNIGEGKSTLSGNNASYQLLYTPSQGYNGYVFFRIKLIDETGSFTYSSINSILVKGNDQISCHLFPNPSITGVQLQFLNSNGGSYSVELYNVVGRTIFGKNYTIDGNGAINIQWPVKPPAGIYYLKVRDLENNFEQVERVSIL